MPDERLSGPRKPVSAMVARGSPFPGRWFWPIVGTMLLAQALLAVDCARRWTPTHDEYWHLPMGVLYWKTGDWRVDPINPPLVRLWASLPLVATGTTLELPEDVHGPDVIPSPEQVGDAFCRQHLAKYRETFFLGRLMIIPLGSMTGLLLAGWARRWFGDLSGLLAGAFWACCPTALANSAIVTHDLAAALGCLAALSACGAWRTQPTWSRAILFGVLLGLAQLTKLTAVLAIPLCGLMLVLLPRGPGGSWRVWVGQAAAALGSAWLVLALQYGSFGLLPEPYLAAWARLRQDLGTQHPIFLNGDWQSQGFPQYYLWVLAYKLPWGTLGALGLAVVAVMTQRMEPLARRRNLFLTAAFAAFFVPASLSGNQLGIRYILPAYPFLILFASQAATWWTYRASRLPAIMITLAAVSLPFALRYHPSHLAYFNELAGGPVGGMQHLSDSNLDWGQDLYDLRDSLRHSGWNASSVKLVYFGSVMPRLLDLPETPPPGFEPQPGRYAVSVNFVQGRPHSLKLPGGEHQQFGLDEFGYFRFFKPVARIGYSIWVYDLSPEDVQRFIALRNQARRRGELP